MVTPTQRRAAFDGILYGVMAGSIFLLAQVFASVAVGDNPWAPVQPFSSIVLGESVIGVPASSGAVVIGFIVHFALSALFGAIYCLANGRLSVKTQTDYGRQSALGMLFGAAVWLLDLELIARIFFPWLLGSGRVTQLVLHALTYGLPLALFYAGAQRRDLWTAQRGSRAASGTAAATSSRRSAAH